MNSPTDRADAILEKANEDVSECVTMDFPLAAVGLCEAAMVKLYSLVYEASGLVAPTKETKPGVFGFIGESTYVPHPLVATTCPYGDLHQHLNDTANCELGEECVYSPKGTLSNVGD